MSVELMLQGFREIFTAPFRDLSVFWIILPLLTLWILLEVYFGMYKGTKLGWNSALANGVTLFWVGIALARYIAGAGQLLTVKFVIALAIMIYGIILTYIAFTHKLPGKIEFVLASPTAIYYLAIVAILWCYVGLELSKWIIADLAVLFAIIIVVLVILRKVIPAKGEGIPEGEEMPELGKEFGREEKMPKLGKI